MLQNRQTNYNNKGHLVKTKKGMIGRTYHHKPHIDGKIPVYPAKDQFQEISQMEFSDHGILCDPDSLELIGFID